MCESSAALVLTVSLAIASGLFAWVTVPAHTTAKQSLFIFLSLKSVGARKTTAYKQPSPPQLVPDFASYQFLLILSHIEHVVPTLFCCYGLCVAY